ncbi:MAG: PQQ-binding-like beta-propeller repeat protein [Planctomycetes bacterium]|nr:PQQ-binding-like beta-propeller repeat protein [Planctomycetota bacterium]
MSPFGSGCARPCFSSPRRRRLRTGRGFEAPTAAASARRCCRPLKGHKDNNLASATPAADAKHVYVAWGGPKEVILLALKHNGAEAWRRDLGPYRAGHGFGNSPIVHDDLVILACEQDGKDCIVALDADTGKERWRAVRKSRNTYATPCIFQAPGRAAELIAVSYEDGITSLDPTSGKPNWAVDAFDKRHVEGAIASPITHGDLVFGTAGWLSVRYETIVVWPHLRPKPGAAVVVETAFKLDRGVGLVPTPIAKDDLLFLWDDRGTVSCCDAKTGENFWRERTEGGFYASPVIAGKHLYCPSRDGDLFVLSASKKFEQAGRIRLGEETNATPAIAGGRLFLRTRTQVMCLEPARN